MRGEGGGRVPGLEAAEDVDVDQMGVHLLRGLCTKWVPTRRLEAVAPVVILADFQVAKQARALSTEVLPRRPQETE